MIIKKLELSNFQVIKEFNADFEGNVYFITGDNELGKSTLLKAIGALLTGNRDAVLRNTTLNCGLPKPTPVVRYQSNRKQPGCGRIT